MTYEQALEWIKANKNLIGTKIEKDLLIGDLVAVPVNKFDRDAFMRTYVLNRHSDEPVIPYTKGELEVWAIDTYHMETSGVLFYKKLAE